MYHIVGLELTGGGVFWGLMDRQSCRWHFLNAKSMTETQRPYFDSMFKIDVLHFHIGKYV